MAALVEQNSATAPDIQQQTPELISLDKRPVFLTGTSHPQLAINVATAFDRLIHTTTPTVVQQPVSKFDESGERRVVIEENVRGRDVVIVHPTAYNYEAKTNVNDAVMELILMIDAVKRAGAEKVRVIIPNYGYARQDRKPLGREPISASAIANILANQGVDTIVTVDLHAGQTQGSFPRQWDDLWAQYALLPALEQELPEPLVVVSPDEGGVRRAERMAKSLKGGVPMASIYKRRDPQNGKVETKGLMGSDVVKGNNTLLLDDIGAGLTSLAGSAKVLADYGAIRIFGAVVHGQFYGDALQKLDDSPIERLYTTDTIAHRDEVLAHPKIQVVSIADMLAEAIVCIQTNGSILESLKN